MLFQIQRRLRTTNGTYCQCKEKPNAYVNIRNTETVHHKADPKYPKFTVHITTYTSYYMLRSRLNDRLIDTMCFLHAYYSKCHK